MRLSHEANKIRFRSVTWENPVVDYLDELEIGICLRINGLSRREFVRRFFSVVSRLGDYPAWVAAGIVVAIMQGADAIPFVVQAAVTAAAGIAAYKLLKKKLVRERPYIANGSIVLGEAPLDRYSFPSGHTLHAVSLTTLYASYEPMLSWLLVPYALLVAASRIILGLHYPSDVIAGAALGATLAAASVAVFG